MALKTRPKKTVSDYMRLPDNVRAELIDGEILMMSPSPSYRHQCIVTNVYDSLGSFVKRNALGRVLVAPLDVHLPSGDIVQPDVIYLAKANSASLIDWIRGVPDLLVEVISPSHPERDRFVKRELYARNGVQEYWLVDADTPSVEILKLAGSSYATHGYFENRDTLESPLLSGFSAPTAALFT